VTVYGDDLKPTVCGGTGGSATSALYYTPTHTSYFDTSGDVSSSGTSYISIYLIAAAVSIGLACLFGILLIIRRKVKKRELARAGNVNVFAMRTYYPPEGQNAAPRRALTPTVTPANPPRRWVFR
jgi:hypothetical protein